MPLTASPTPEEPAASVSIETAAREFAAWEAAFERARKAVDASLEEGTIDFDARELQLGLLFADFADRLTQIPLPPSLADEQEALYDALHSIGLAWPDRTYASQEESEQLINALKLWTALSEELRHELGLAEPSQVATPQTPGPTEVPTPLPTPVPTPLPVAAEALTGDFAGLRGGVGMAVSIECYTFYADGTVEIYHDGAVTDIGQYYGDAFGGEIVWGSGRQSVVVANGANLVINGARMDRIQTCRT